jgi:hypothetical protein
VVAVTSSDSVALQPQRPVPCQKVADLPLCGKVSETFRKVPCKVVAKRTQLLCRTTVTSFLRRLGPKRRKDEKVDFSGQLALVDR